MDSEFSIPANEIAQAQDYKDETEDSSASQMQERKRLSCSNHDKQAFSVHDEFQVLKEA